ncbi:MAG: DUF2169 domain-containing protein [Geobacter sp.]|nr:MAG: DUF2169 domain-containing protein [Geobacter sp.]
MNFINNTIFPALAFQSTDQHGQSFHVVVMRATLDIHDDGAVSVSEEQQPIVLTDEYFAEVNKSSVRKESDLVHFKPKCDVIVNATAHAPGGVPSLGFVAGVKINGPPHDNGDAGPLILEKKLLVTGPRYWEKGLLGKWTLNSPVSPIRSLPLRYDYAFGGECRVALDDPGGKQVKAEFRLTPEQRTCHPDGPDSVPLAHTTCENNPLGIGFVEDWYRKAKKLNTIPAPQIDDPKNPVTIFGKNYPPQGFGIITKAWRQRLALAGTYDDAWLETRWPDLPEDFDMSYWNGAHPDLQVPHLDGGEEIRLTNLTPGGLLSFTLPGDTPVMAVRFESGKTSAVPLKIDTLMIDPDLMKVSLVWRVVMPTVPEILLMEIGAVL